MTILTRVLDYARARWAERSTRAALVTGLIAGSSDIVRGQSTHAIVVWIFGPLVITLVPDSPPLVAAIDRAEGVAPPVES